MSSSPKQFDFNYKNTNATDPSAANQKPQQDSDISQHFSDDDLALTQSSFHELSTDRSFVEFDAKKEPVSDTPQFLGTPLKSESTQSDKPQKPKKKRSIGRIFSFFVIILCVGFTLFGGFLMWSGGTNLSQVFGGGGLDIGQILSGKRAELQGEKDGRTNILLIGKDEEAGLTDTMIVASYYYKEGKMTTLSLPRDFLMNDGYSTSKINSIMAYADQRYTSGQSSVLPERFLSDLIGKELGIPIHYWTSVNFDGVEQIVNTFGGITVNVENSFSDCQYPNKNYGYIRPCPSFKAGETTMDGTTALIFSRSRYSFDNPAEAIDFARSRRQQLVIQAIVNKAKTQMNAGSLVLNPGKLNEYLTILGGNVKTSIKPNEVLSFFEIFKQTDNLVNSSYRFAIDFDSGIICESKDGSSNLIYCDGSVGGASYSGSSKIELQRIAQNILPELQTRELSEKSVAIVGNLSDLTPKAKQAFINSGYTNIKYSNTLSSLLTATSTSVEKATVYISNKDLRDKFQASTKPNFDFEVKETPPAGLVSAPYSTADIIVIVQTVS